jgi:DNA-binding NarL/FixJ family response regulator
MASRIDVVVGLVFARIAELAQQHNRCAPEPTVRVTSRECEILQLLAHGCHNAEIAHQLGITLHTVKNHVHHILEKFQARGRREVIQRAYQHGMLTGPRPSRVPLAQSWV